MGSSDFFTDYGLLSSSAQRDYTRKMACIFAGMNHLQPLLLATTNSHYLLDRFCMERCCSSEYVSRIVTSIIFMEILSILVVRIILYMVFKEPPIWKNWKDWRNWLTCTGWSPDWQSDKATGDTLLSWNEPEEKWKGIVGSIILCLITLGYIQIFYAFVTGGKKGHMHWFYTSLLIQHFLNSLIAGSIGFWDVGLALWYLVTLPMGPVVVFFYQLIIHSWIRNNGPRNVEYIVVEWQIGLVSAISILATIYWIYAYCQPYVPTELDLSSWSHEKCSPHDGYYFYSVRDSEDIWAGGKCLYTSMYPTDSSSSSSNPTHLYLEIVSGGTVQKKYYHKPSNSDPWKEYTDSSHIRTIDLVVNGVLGMTILEGGHSKNRRVSIRKEDTSQYVGTPRLGRYRVYSYTPQSGTFNIHNFTKPGPYGSETLKLAPNGPPTNRVSLVIVYCSLGNYTPLLIYYHKSGESTGQHNWYKNTGKDNTWKSADGLNANTPPPQHTPAQNAQTVRNVLEEVNCLVNGVVQINVSNQAGTYCHNPTHSSNYRISVKNLTNTGPYQGKLPDSPGTYTVFEHTPRDAKTLTISAFKNGPNKYLNGIPTTGTSNDSYLSGVTRVVVFLKGGNPCLIYYERPNEGNPTEQHKWYEYQNGTSTWQEHQAELRNKSPEDVARNGTSLKRVLQDIRGDTTGQEHPDSDVQSTGQPDLSDGTPTPQYNREYHNILPHAWLPLIMQGLSVGAVGSIFPNLIPKTLTCPKTSRSLSVINMFLVTVPHIFNVMLGDNDVNPASKPWEGPLYSWQYSWLLYIIYILAILFAIFNVHYPDWALSTFLRSNTWMVFLMILFTDVLNDVHNDHYDGYGTPW